MHKTQKQIADFVARYGLDSDVAYRLLDLVSEVGELSKAVLKATDYGEQAFQAGATNGTWEEELGDVLFSLICVANATGVDLEQGLAAVLEKYRNRFQRTQDVGSGR